MSTHKDSYKHILCRFAGAAVLALLPLLVRGQIAGHTSEQIAPLGAAYFQNQYLANPSMAGRDSALNINVAYRAENGNVPGAPVTHALTADDYIGHHVGVGLIAYNDQAGLFNKTDLALTYAYHLQLGQKGQQLHFGLSLGYEHDRIDPKAVEGDQGDASIATYNNRTDHIECDYGMTYTNAHWTLQAVLPDIISYMLLYPGNVVNRSTFLTAASYRFPLDGQINCIEPKILYRGVQGMHNIVDIGANIAFLHNMINIFGLYHTTDDFTAGAGLHYKSLITLQMIYNTQTAGLQNYFDGTYEVNVGLSLFKHR